jgi:hypothetical protein
VAAVINGFETAFTYLVASCVRLGAKCPMGRTVSGAEANYDALISHLQAAPLSLGPDDVLTGAALTGLVSRALHAEVLWPGVWKASVR